MSVCILPLFANFFFFFSVFLEETVAAGYILEYPKIHIYPSNSGAAVFDSFGQILPPCTCSYSVLSCVAVGGIGY